MVKRHLKQNFSLPHVAVFMQWLIVLSVLLVAANNSYSQDRRQGYFYLQENVSGNPVNSCAKIFSEIIKGRAEDVGGVVRSLKSINVQYWLEDYDNALSTDRRKINYLKLDDLLTEVAENKGSIYCQIELAIYMKNHASFKHTVYDKLLNEAFQKLDSTYSSALDSFERGDFARASYAFDLIAPYRDSQQRYLQASNNHTEESTEKIVAVPEKTKPTLPALKIKSSSGTGPIAIAVDAMINRADAKEGAAETKPGPIALAARLGPITAAVNAMEAEGTPPE